MSQLPELTWKRFGYWLAIGLIIYFGYGFRRSRLHPGSSPRTRAT
jgi:APA family basic amino acid/polyamine antiporter